MEVVHQARQFLVLILGVLTFSTAAAAQQAADSLLPPVVDRPSASRASINPASMGGRPLNPQLTRDDVAAWLGGFRPYALGRADIPGAVVAVVKDGQLLVSRGYGFANVETPLPASPSRTLLAMNISGQGLRAALSPRLRTWRAL